MKLSKSHAILQMSIPLIDMVRMHNIYTIVAGFSTDAKHIFFRMGMRTTKDICTPLSSRSTGDRSRFLLLSSLSAGDTPASLPDRALSRSLQQQ